MSKRRTCQPSDWFGFGRHKVNKQNANKKCEDLCRCGENNSHCATGSCLSLAEFFTTGYTALIWAAKEGHLEVVKVLIEAKADVNQKDNDGMPKHKSGCKGLVVRL